MTQPLLNGEQIMSKQQKFETTFHEHVKLLINIHKQWLDGLIPENEMYFKIEMAASVYGRKLYEQRIKNT